MSRKNMPSITRIHVVSAIIFFIWLAISVLHVRREFPNYRADAESSGNIISSPIFDPFDSWMEIYYKGQKLGYTHSTLTHLSRKDSILYALRHTSRLKLLMLGREENLLLDGMSFFNEYAELKEFSFQLQSRDYRLVVKGERSEDGLVIIYNTGKDKNRFTIDVPDDLLVSEDLNFILSRRKFKVGANGHFNIFDPMTMSREALYYNVVDEENGIFELKISYRGLESRLWIDNKGKIKKEITPLGWVMRASTRAQALTKIDADVDLAESVAISVLMDIPDPRGVTYSRFQVTGIDGSIFDAVEVEGQTIDMTDGKIIVEVRSTDKQVLNDQGLSLPVDPAKWGLYLKPEMLIQVDHPDIKDLVRNIIGDEMSLWQAAKMIRKWVYENVKKEPAISVPSALDVLKMRQGDCNEHTVLFTALARAAGIPAVTCVGLVFMDRKFYYHAWPAVYVGQWVSMDPTLGQDVADATHIAIITGGLEKQAQIISLVDKIKIEVLEYR